MFGFEMTALAGAIFMLIVLLQLRHVLARCFPTLKARIISAKPPKSVSDLYEKAHEELIALGFEGPTWLLRESEPEEAGYQPLCAVYRHSGEGSLAWLMPPITPAMPNRLLGYWTTKLQDGTLVTSQPFDPFFACIATPETPAQTIDGMTVADQWQQHQKFRGKFAAQTDMASLTDAAIVKQAGEELNQQREQLLQRGSLWRDSHGVCRPRLLFALRMLWKIVSRPKPKEVAQPVPPSRLAILANTLERIRHAEPSKNTQIGLFGASVLLSVTIGAIVWDLRFAVILLAVVLFHELGHFLAMRAFGYRNVHMMALPLVGGVTMGYDANPDAAKKAWMSLMGPLPGIIVGWAMVASLFMLDLSSDTSSLLYTAAWVTLLVNYLNILPVLPLDGGHVVQSLLPPRWLNVQAAIIVVLCLTGALVSLAIGMYILAILAGTQLLLVRTYGQKALAVRRLLAKGVPPVEHKRPMRLLRVLELLEDIAGPAKNAQQRINQAEHVLLALDTKPMSLSQRSILSFVYGGLLVVPLTAIVLTTVLNWDTGFSTSDYTARLEQDRQQREVLVQQARSKPLDVLLQEVHSRWSEDALPGPADNIAFIDTQARLGARLGEDLQAIYRIANGVPSLGLAPLAGLQRAANAKDLALEDYLYQGKLGVNAGEYENTQYHEILLERANRWIYLGAADGGESLLFMDTDDPPAIPGYRFIDFYYESPQAYESMRAWLESRWVSEQWSQQVQIRHEQAKHAKYQSLVEVGMPDLLEHFEHPSLLVKLLAQLPDWPEGAADGQITATEARLGMSFPEDLRVLYQQHNGFPPLSLLSLEEMNSVTEFPENEFIQFKDQWQLIQSDGEEKTLTINKQQITHCVTLAGTPAPESASSEMPVYPSMLWCPKLLSGDDAYLLLYQQRVYTGFTNYVRDMAAARTTD
jgi:Zn-dependent protease